MTRCPLEAPAPDSSALRLFLESSGIERQAPPRELLRRVTAAFGRFPYENLTKIVKRSDEGDAGRARRPPLEVIAEHLAHGSGGTCFSLTAAFLHVVRALGWRASPVLADRSYGENTHCALVVWIDGAPHFVDPGFLILDPVPLPTSGEHRLRTPFNELALSCRGVGSKLDLHTLQGNSRVHRMTIKTEPAEPDAFLAAWDASFAWGMMRYPVLTRVRGASHVYLQGTRLQVRSPTGVEKVDVDPAHLPAVIEREFGLSPSIASRALEVLRRKGESLAAATAR